MRQTLALAALTAVMAGAAPGCAGPTSSQSVAFETGAQRARREAAESNQTKLDQADRALARGEIGLATRLYREVAEAEPEAMRPREQLANMALREHRYGDAERWLREIIALAPDETAPRYQLVSVLLRTRRVDEARREFQAAESAMNPDPKTELRLKAALALRAGQTTQAARLYDDYIAAYPDEAAGYVGLAVTLAQAGEFDSALTTLGKAQTIAPSSAVVQYNAALIWYRKGDLDRAIDYGLRAVALDPGYLPARTNLAAALLQRGRVGEARAQLEAALADRPGYAPAHNNLGVVLLTAGDVAGATAEFEKAAHHAPRVAAFHFNLGVAHFRAGRIAEARAAFAVVVDLSPTDQGARKNLTWIDGVLKGTIKGAELPEPSSQYTVDEFDE